MLGPAAIRQAGDPAQGKGTPLLQFLKVPQMRPGMVAYVCNPSYWRGSDQEDHSLRLALAKKLTRPHHNKQAGCGGMYPWSFLSNNP
jgi:hypothetical protein